MTDTAKKPVRAKAVPPKPYDPAALNVSNEVLDERDLEKMQKSLDNPDDKDLVDALSRTALARSVSQPEVRSALVIQTFDSVLDVNAVVTEMRDQSAEIRKGSMGRAEEMLIAQAHSLDALFCNLARRAHSNMGQGNYLHAAETYMRLALRAQNQCRTTLETLSTIKNPPVVFAKQMNVSNGPQQVNNGVGLHPEPMAKDVTHALENETEQNEMRGGSSHELLEDTRASQATRRIDTQRKAVGARHRTEDTGGQSSIKP